MDTIKMTFEVPRDLVVALNVSPPQIAERMQELIAVELFREGQISSGKGAEILGVSKFTFVQLLAQRGVFYFTESSEELTTDVTATAALLATQNR